MSKKYKNIIWDWNGTLLNDVPLVLSVVNSLLSDHNLTPVQEDYYKKIFTFPVSKFYEKIGFDLSIVDFSQLSDSFCSQFEKGLSKANLFPAVKSTIINLSDYKHFILSATEHKTLTRMLKLYDIDEFFIDHFGLSNNLANCKKEVGSKLIKSHGLQENQTIMFGDTIHDSEVASYLNIDCCLISSGHNSYERLSEVGVPVINSLSSINSILT